MNGEELDVGKEEHIDMNVQLKYLKSFHRKEIKLVLFFCRWEKTYESIR